MPFYEYLAIGLMVTFILALFTGYPVAWLLAGLSLLFAGLGITLGEMGYDTFLMTSWAKFSGVIDRFDSIMSNWVLVSLPMFVYMGLMLDKSGVADTMMRNFVKVFGGIRGGLAGPGSADGGDEDITPIQLEAEPGLKHGDHHGHPGRIDAAGGAAW